MALADSEYQLLGLVQRHIGISLFIGNARDLARRVDQSSQDRRSLDDAPIMLNIGACRHAIDQRRDIASSADIFQLALPLKLIAERNKVRWLPLLVELKNR